MIKKIFDSMFQVSGILKSVAVKRLKFAGLKMCLCLKLIICFESMARVEKMARINQGWR